MPRKPRNYAAEYARRIARGLAKGLSRSQARGHPKPNESALLKRRSPKPLADEQLQRALRILRQEKSLSAAAKAARVSPERLKHFAASKGAIQRQKRRWIVSPDLPRRMLLYSRGRAWIVTVRDYASASIIGRYMHGLRRFLESNDPVYLAPFVGASVTDINGKRHPFEIDPNVLYRLASAGGESFEQVYRVVI